MARTREEVFAMLEEFKKLTFEEQMEQMSLLYEDKIFRCNVCGEMVSFGDLEDWCCNFADEDNNEEYLICSFCYEEGMGEDL